MSTTSPTFRDAIDLELTRSGNIDPYLREENEENQVSGRANPGLELFLDGRNLKMNDNQDAAVFSVMCQSRIASRLMRGSNAIWRCSRKRRMEARARSPTLTGAWLVCLSVLNARDHRVMRQGDTWF
jgi:hypothetical protein